MNLQHLLFGRFFLLCVPHKNVLLYSPTPYRSSVYSLEDEKGLFLSSASSSYLLNIFLSSSSFNIPLLPFYFSHIETAAGLASRISSYLWITYGISSTHAKQLFIQESFLMLWCESSYVYSYTETRVVIFSQDSGREKKGFL